MENIIHTLPTVAMRGLVVFPYMQLNFDVARPASIKALEAASNGDSKIFLVTQKKAEIDNPKPDDIYRVGTIAQIKQIMHLPGNVTRLIVKGLSRGIIREYDNTEPYLMCKVEEVNELPTQITNIDEAYARALKSKLEEYFAVNPKLQADKFMSIMDIKPLGQLCDTIAALTELDTEDKQVLLNNLDCEDRAEELLSRLEHLIDVTELEHKILRKTHEKINENQHEYFLREQMHVIEEELGDKDGIGADAEGFRKKIESLRIKKESKEKLLKDVERFAKLPSNSPDSSVLRSYLENVLELPWDKAKKEIIDRKHVMNLFKLEMLPSFKPEI